MQVKLAADEWRKILPVLKSRVHEIRLGAGRGVRRFLEAVLWQCPLPRNNSVHSTYQLPFPPRIPKRTLFGQIEMTFEKQ